MHLERVGAVLEVVRDRRGVPRKLARLARRHETRAQLVGERAAEDEAARLGAHHLGHARVGERIGKRVDRAAEPLGAREQRRDVLEDDAFFGPVGDVTDVGGQVHGVLLGSGRHERTLHRRAPVKAAASRACADRARASELADLVLGSQHDETLTPTSSGPASGWCPRSRRRCGSPSM